MDTESRPGIFLNGRGIARGFCQLIPISLFFLPFGVSYGAAALAAGIEPTQIMLMSSIVFAASAQFAMLDLWSHPIPVITIAMTVLAVNARFIIYGMALSPWLLRMRRFERLLTVGLLTDLNYAHAVPSRQSDDMDAGFLFGGGVAIWLTWVSGTGVGILVGSKIADPARFGLDTVMVAYFVPILVRFWQPGRSMRPWSVAALVTALATTVLPTGWPVLAGAVAGALSGTKETTDADA